MRETRNKSKSKSKGKRIDEFVLTLILNNALLLILLYFISLATPNEWTGRRGCCYAKRHATQRQREQEGKGVKRRG